MMQGDQYGLGIDIVYEEDGTPVTKDDVADVEITIGHLKKTYKEGKVTFSNGQWVFPVTQEETFRYMPSLVDAQARIVWPNGEVEGVPLGKIRVLESRSKEVL